MKIIIPVFGFGKSGGERVLSKMANELIKHNNDVFFVAPNNGSVPYYETDAEIVRSYCGSKFNRIINFLITYYHLYQACRQLKPDIVIANFHLTAYLVFLLPHKIKKFYYIQAYEVVFYKNILRKALAYITYYLPLRKITNHNQLLPGYLNGNKVVIPAGVDIKTFYSRGCINAKKNVGVIGRVEKHKGTKEIIDAIIAWDNKHKVIINIAIYISEEDQERLIDNGVKFNYFKINNDNELADFYRCNDLIIATGLVEDGAFHYPCAEAMSSGCIVISNYAPLVDTESCFKITHLETELMLEKLDCFLASSHEDIQNEIAKNIANIKSYSWDVVGSKFNNTLSK